MSKLNDLEQVTITTSVEENVQMICEALYHSSDILKRPIETEDHKGMVIFIETMVDSKKIVDMFLLPALEASPEAPFKEKIASEEVAIRTKLSDVIDDLLSGKTIILLENSQTAFSFQTIQEAAERTPEEPDAEKIVRGAHIGFIENIYMNIHLIRKRIVDRRLNVQLFTIGQETKEQVAMLYMEDLADEMVVEKIKKKLTSLIDKNAVSTMEISHFLEGNTYSPFPQNLSTERPDKLTKHLMKGRVAVLVNGIAYAVLLPVTFFSFFQSPDDDSLPFYSGTIFRLFRLFSFFGALIFPALYIAVINFHFEIIPYELISLVKSSIENVPFPAFYEALIMAVTIELVREAGIRLPSPIGQSIGIVGGIIIGDAVVTAGLVSNIVVIVIAITAIMSFTVPVYEMGNSIRIFTLPTMIAASLFGFIGIIICVMVLIFHLCRLHNYGVPYFYPLAPFDFQAVKEMIIRVPIKIITPKKKAFKEK